MQTDPNMIQVYRHYWWAEIRGADSLLQIMKRVTDGEMLYLLTLHLADEIKHASLWAKLIKKEGGVPIRVEDGYYELLLKEVRPPRTLLGFLAFTIAIEEASQHRYLQHLASPHADPKALPILREITDDEKWHLGWIRNKFEELATASDEQEQSTSMLQRSREASLKAFATLAAKEREVFGYSFSDSPSPDSS